MRKQKQSGFSLIELLIVVAIILVIAAIAIPSLMKAKMSANEASAVQSMRAIQSAETAYATAYPLVGYSSTLAALSEGSGTCTGSSTQACLLDPVLATGTKDGYIITWTGDGLTPSVTYNMNADPITRGASGQRSFYTDFPGVIRYNNSVPASSNDPTI